MREVHFIKHNQARWQELEGMVAQRNSASATELARAYVQLMDDLAFSRAQFPAAQCTAYLNNLAMQIHSAVARNKRLRRERVRNLLIVEIPSTFVDIRAHLAIAFVVFIAFAALGYIAAIHDESFVRSVLGNGYVDMTVENIKSGKPLEVYNQDSPLLMFLHIGFNNIMILLRSVGLGLLPIAGVAYLLVPNAVMIGTFMGLFSRYNELGTAVLGVWIHGTLEISAIIVGCAAAIRVTQAVLHPGTYPRKEAFAKGLRSAILVVVGMVPLLVVAAILESFVTRFYNTSPILNLSIIICSAVFVVWYVVIWPQKLLKRSRNER